MSTPNTAIELPGELYDRLEAMAKAEKVDPITLIENLLRSIERRNRFPAEEEPSTVPLYRVYEHAIDMGVTDLAQNLDHYLYGLEKEPNNE